MDLDSEESNVFPGLKILQSLGRGGMSIVYKARQLELDRIVAVKVISSKVSEETLKRFQNEAKLTSKLEHPNIVKTLSFGITSRGLPYLVLEYIEGRSLADYLKEKGRLSYGEFKNIFLPVLQALAHAHEKGLLHRDLKPGNIMILSDDSAEENVKVVDFGIAKVMQPDDYSGEMQQLTKTGSVLGSPAYMSPEQCQGLELDQRSDLYSLACVMYESFLGKTPFLGDSVLELMGKHVNEALPTVAELQKTIELDREISALILRALAKDPASRPASAAEFYSKLSSALGGLSSDRIPELYTTALRQKKFIDKLRAAGIVIALAALVTAPFCSSLFEGTAAYLKTLGRVLIPLDEKKALEMLEQGDRLLRQNHDPEKALEFFETGIEGLQNSGHRPDLLCDAYFKAALCVRNLNSPAGRLPDREQSASTDMQVRWYIESALENARVRKNTRDFVKVCKGYCNYLGELNPDAKKEIELALLDRCDRFCKEDSEDALDFRLYVINSLLAAGCRGLEPVIEKELMLVQKKHDPKSCRYLEARANQLHCRVLENGNAGLEESVRELSEVLISSRHPSFKRESRRVTLICGPICKCLSRIKKPDLLAQIVENEINTNLGADDQLYKGKLFTYLADAYKSCNQPEPAFEYYDKGIKNKLEYGKQTERLYERHRDPQFFESFAGELEVLIAYAKSCGKSTEKYEEALSEVNEMISSSKGAGKGTNL